MAIILSEYLRDGEIVLTGANSAVPAAACRLAQLTHAPNLTYVSGGSGAVNSRLSPLCASSCDFRNLNAECVLRLDDLFDLISSGIDVFFAGGLQIDRYGNCNMVGIGKEGGLRFRGPGSLGLPLSSRAKRVAIYTTRHDRRVFVERVDFSSSPGHDRIYKTGNTDAADDAVSGPDIVVTPLAVFDFRNAGRTMRLVSVHPGVSVDEVVRNTGFQIDIHDRISTTPEPSPSQVGLLRQLDTKGILR